MAVHARRDQVLAYRLTAHELFRPDPSPAADGPPPAVLGLGVQDTPPGSAALALAARRAPDTVSAAVKDPAVTLAWSVRGAPHLHRTADLARVAAAVWPLDDADAESRLATSGRAIKKAGVSGLEAFRLTAEAMHAVVTKPMAKGEVSTAVTVRLPDALAFDCKPCGARHVYGSLFQAAALAGGVRLERRGASTALAPIPGWADAPPRDADPGLLITAYLTLMGPSPREAVAAFLSVKPAALAKVWPDDLVEATVDGAQTWLPQAAVKALESAEPRKLVRLLPPGDPYLQARDRELLLPDADRRSLMWRAINSPGAVLADGEIVGVWQGKAAGAKAVDVAVTAFAALSKSTRAAVEAEAQSVATVRGVAEARVRYTDA